MKRFRHLATVSVIAATAASLTACGMGDRSREAGRVHAAVDKAIAAKTVRASMTITVDLDEELAQADVAAALSAAAGSTTEMQAVADIEFARKRAQVLLPNGIPTPQLAAQPEAPPEAPPEATPEGEPAAATPAPAIEGPGIVFAGPITFVRRPDAGEKARNWFAYDYRRTADDERGLSANADPATVLASVTTTVHPLYFVELLGGVLPGSLKAAGTEGEGADLVTRYVGNLSLEKARTSSQLDLDDDARQLRERAFALVGVRGDIVETEIALARDGTARKLVVRLPSRPSRRVLNTITVSIDFAEYGSARDLPLPSRDASVRVDGYAPLVRAVAGGD